MTNWQWVRITKLSINLEAPRVKRERSPAVYLGNILPARVPGWARTGLERGSGCCTLARTVVVHTLCLTSDWCSQRQLWFEILRVVHGWVPGTQVHLPASVFERLKYFPVEKPQINRVVGHCESRKYMFLRYTIELLPASTFGMLVNWSQKNKTKPRTYNMKPYQHICKIKNVQLN